MATHNPHEAGAVCDDIVVLGRGRVLGQGSVVDFGGTTFTIELSAGQA